MASSISTTGSGTTSGTTAKSGSTTATGGSAIAGNFNQFLTILTTQLRNQNPLDPLDTNQFTQQLVQFASVEQQLKTNDLLSTMTTANKSATAASTAGLIGRTVTADGATSTLADGKASWTLTAARAAPKATITISDAKGNVVATQTKALASGSQTFAWDGRTSTGQLAPGGKYTVKIQATDATGQKVAVDTKVSGTISAIDLSGTEPMLTVDDAEVPLSSVQSLGSASS
ncbi:flagellar hook assembly protein FlgD [uncultured Methylobacterium sp.]|jgi:flagellar basal-body rod modification protein FlgD|uniref:flagellar hook assembly protein FlgD n=1 Tax=uncultured Methylobacterium sp. TaxID=157278 RepID=UPI00262CE4F1|nr:flagellar hook assembly protein FlgD [uncultured Methylobacterium sp.]